jgi:hypothetical protein
VEVNFAKYRFRSPEEEDNSRNGEVGEKERERERVEKLGKMWTFMEDLLPQHCTKFFIDRISWNLLLSCFLTGIIL